MNIYYTGYITKNLITGQLYYGVHRTVDWNDNYFGSGKKLNAAIKQYGKQNFKKRIVAFFDNSDDMWEWERKIITKDVVVDNFYYNMIIGGTGVYGKEVSPFSHPQKYPKELHEKIIKNRNLAINKYRQEGRGRNFSPREREIGCMMANSKKAKNKRRETYKKISHQQGKINSQYGTRWITDGVLNKKIKNTEKLELGWYYGRTAPNSLSGR